jgi:hypothetical protein
MDENMYSRFPIRSRTIFARMAQCAAISGYFNQKISKRDEK